uniref:Prolyl endopeptidase n=1 Tax=Panagrellus redivivus TaxID=6233 RepID=A0A7E4WBH5_PANRE
MRGHHFKPLFKRDGNHIHCDSSRIHVACIYTMLPLVVVSLLLVGSTAEIIPRSLLFSDQKYSSVSLSPDGNVLAYLAPNEEGISNIYTRCVTCQHTKVVTFDNKRHIGGFQWTAVPDLMLFYQDTDGDENFKLYKLNISNPSPQNQPHVISDRPGVKVVIIANNLITPRVLIGLNDENPAFHNVYEFDLLTNEMTRVLHNKRFPPNIVVDNDLQIRLVSEEADDGSLVYLRPSNKANLRQLTSDKDLWVEYIRVSPEDRPLTMPVAFNADNSRVYWQWGEGTDLGQLVIHDFGHPDKNEVLYTAVKAQIGSVLLHPTDFNVLALSEVYHKPELYVANNSILDDMQYLVNLRPTATPVIASISLDFHTWLVTYVSDEKPYEYYLYRRWQQKAEYLFTTRPELVGRKINKMVGFSFEARDGLPLQAYLSLPPEASLVTPLQANGSDVELAKLGLLPSTPQPLIVFVHGGPKARDVFGYSSTNAWLTNRGYAVLQVNFRGSVGFGKKLTNSGNGEWGRKMHHDLLDAVNYAVEKGIADPKRIAIMGGSYGGYATLVGLTFTPDTFACGVDIVGPSNLNTLIDTIPPYWAGFRKDMIAMLGADNDTPEGRESLKSRSPLFFSDRVKKPLLVIHGANDPRVKQAEADQFVDSLKNISIPVTYILYPDEGHGMRKPENNLAMTGFVEEFLHKCLGGELEPFHLGQYNSSALVMASADKPHEPRLKTLNRSPTFRRPYYNTPAASQIVRDDVFVGDVFTHTL